MAPCIISEINLSVRSRRIFLMIRTKLRLNFKEAKRMAMPAAALTLSTVQRRISNTQQHTNARKQKTFLPSNRTSLSDTSRRVWVARREAGRMHTVRNNQQRNVRRRWHTRNRYYRPSGTDSSLLFGKERSIFNLHFCN